MVGGVPVDLGWVVAGLLLLTLGYLIRGRGWSFLVAGYDDAAAIPEDVVTSAVGNLALRVGILSLVVGVIAPRQETRYLGLLVGALIVLDTLLVIYRLNTGEFGVD
jgi:hypothetical protein